MRDVKTTYREKLEEWILENLPLLILVSNHWDVDFAEVLREQENQTDRAVGKRQKTERNVSLTLVLLGAWPSLTATCVIVFKHGMSIHHSQREVRASANMSFYTACIILVILGKDLE